MENLVQPHRWKFLGILGLGVPLTSLVLLLTQVQFSPLLATLRHRAFSSLEAPFRYPFDVSRGDRNLALPLQQEVAHYQQQVKARPDSALDQAALAVAYLRLARLTGQSNWYLLAEQTAQRSLAQLPFDNTGATVVLARVAEARHDFPTAILLSHQVNDEREALAIQASSYLALGRLEEASQATDRWVALTASMAAFTLQGVVYTAQGNDQQALQSFRYALEIEEPGELSQSVRLRTLLGRYYYERGELGQAEQFYQEALAILPNDPVALLNLAQLKLRQKDYSSAHRIYARLKQVGDNLPMIYDPLLQRGLARLYVLQGDRQTAERHWAEAEQQLRTRLTGNYPATGTAAQRTATFGHQRDLAQLLLERGRAQDLPEVITLLQAELALRRDADTLALYAWALSRTRHWEDARQAVQEAIATGTQDAALYYRAGMIEQGLGRLSQAEYYFQRAYEIDPTFGDPAIYASGLGIGLGL